MVERAEDRGEKPQKGQKKLRVLLRTFGCQMNLRDSEFAMGILLESGFVKADSAENADVVIFNSCSVRKHAEDRLFSNISELKDMKKRKSGMVIGLMGCTAQNYKEKVLERAPLVDFVCGPGNKNDLPRLIRDVAKNRCPVIATDKVNDKGEELFPEYREQGFKAFVSISEGCDNYCSYCIVPYVRGRERSRNAKDIIKEVKNLAERGFKEITLLGQNVNSYGRTTNDKRRTTGFVRLLEELNKIEGINRIRFMTSHPKNASTELFEAMRDLENVCEHLHLPLQSGSDKILRLMNRGYTSSKYLNLADSYKRLLPSGSITTDIIVGFPSEAKVDFEKTRRLMERIGFDSAFLFKYSPRLPAESAKLKDDVPQGVKEDRLGKLLELQRGISEERNAPMKGMRLEILVDGFSKKDVSLLTGRTRTNKIAVFKGDKRLIGRSVDVKIESVTPYALKGRIA